MHILLVEDDTELASQIGKALREAGHVVDHCGDGRTGLLQASSESYDVVVLDRMLPEVEGLKLVKTLRAVGDTTPVLIMSALGDVDERVKGLRAGGDDYLAKPVALSELLARVEALGRRRGPAEEQTNRRIGDLSIDLLGRKVERAGRQIDLTRREFDILDLLVRNAGRIVTRSMLLETVWNYHFDPQTNVIDQHVSRLRRKVDANFDRPLIHTLRGIGYMVQA